MAQIQRICGSDARWVLTTLLVLNILVCIGNILTAAGAFGSNSDGEESSNISTIIGACIAIIISVITIWATWSAQVGILKCMFYLNIAYLVLTGIVFVFVIAICIAASSTAAVPGGIIALLIILAALLLLLQIFVVVVLYKVKEYAIQADLEAQGMNSNVVYQTYAY